MEAQFAIVTVRRDSRSALASPGGDRVPERKLIHQAEEHGDQYHQKPIIGPI